MLTSKALFYPTIDIRDEKWLKNAILFWDEISTIVPDSYTHPYESDITAILAEKGILKPIRVNSSDRLIENLSDIVLKYLDTNEAFQVIAETATGRNNIHRNKLPRLFDERAFLHPEKLSHEIQYRLDSFLNRGDWYEVDRGFASFYMTLLANAISENKGLPLLTNNSGSSNLMDTIRLDNKVPMVIHNDNFNRFNHGSDHVALRQGVLLNMIIEGLEIDVNASIEDIVAFKRDNNYKLMKFRENIIDLTTTINNASTPQMLQEEVKELYNQKFLPSYNDLKKDLNSSGIKWASDNPLKVAFISTSASSIMPMMGISIPQAIFASAGISMIASVISYNETKKEILRNNPYSYLMAINNWI
jgi:hypothetical protein